MSTPYQGTYTIPAAVRGDSIPAWSVQITRTHSAEPITAASLHLRTTMGRLVHEWPITIEGGDTVRMAEIPGTTTRAWPLGSLAYDLELTYGSEVRTYLRGTLTIEEDITR
jgi:hypothetical protein